MALFDLVSMDLPVVGVVEAAMIVWYLLGFIAIVIIGAILYVISTLEKSMMGSGGEFKKTGGTQPPAQEEQGYDNYPDDYDHHDDYYDHHDE